MRPFIVKIVLAFALLLLAACRAETIVVVVTATPHAIPTNTTTAVYDDEEISDDFLVPHPILADLRVRQAIAHCTNTTELIRSVYPWFDQPERLQTETMFPQDHWAYAGDEPGFELYAFDPETGQALLDDSGWLLANGATYRTNASGEELALKLTTTNATFRQTWAAVFEEQMKVCGIRLVRLHTPSEWFFGETTGLQRRDFELAAFAWVISPALDLQSIYACDQVPLPSNNWAGQNYSNWCNEDVDDALPVAAYHDGQQTRLAALQLIQQKFSKDVPSVPLFQRLEVYAINPALENFAPNVSEYYTWNAEQWQVPGKDTLVIVQTREPKSLAETNWSTEGAALQMLVHGYDYTALNYDFQPKSLDTLPDESSPLVFVNIVQAKAGEQVVDINGYVTPLSEQVRLYNLNGEIEWFDGQVWLKQYIVTYRFKPNLTWADGTPVSRDDYKLAYTLSCQPDTALPAYLGLNYNCDKIWSVDFLDDHSYTVTWMPGFQSQEYRLPPFGRWPSQRVLSDGRQLNDLNAAELAALPELTRTPLGTGPYQVAEWEAGQFIHFTANPYYYAGQPATPNLIVRFVETAEEAIALLKNGEADILAPGAFDISSQTPELLQAQAEGHVRVLSVPMNVYEHLDFNLFVP